MYIANVAREDGFENNSIHWMHSTRKLLKSEGRMVVLMQTKLEAEISELDIEECSRIPDEMEEEPGLNRVIRAGYELLGLQTYFTSGCKEVYVAAMDSQTGRNRPQAPGVIHTELLKRLLFAPKLVSYANEGGSC